MNQTVVGLFNTAYEAQKAVSELKTNGFSDNDVDLSVSSNSDASAGSFTMGSTDTDRSRTNFDLDKDNEKESGVSRFFKNLFGSDDNNSESYSQANRYSEHAGRGSSIVTVHTSSADAADKAAVILDDCGAINVDEDAIDSDTYDTNTGIAPVGMFNETTGATATTPDSDYDVMSDNSDKIAQLSAKSNTTGDDKISIIEENLNVGKRTVETGGARLRSRIVSRPVEENLRLREERVYVNRNPVNRPATSADFDTFKEGQVELKEYAEVPVVSKEARVVEEISLGKEATERNETIRDTVRKTEVDVEQIPGKTTTGLSDDDITLTKRKN